MVDIIHRVGIKAPMSRVYAALSTIEGLAGWWTKETTGASQPGGNIEFQFSSPSGERIGGIDMEVMALDPDKEVRWRVKSGPEEWVGTDVVFKLSRDGDYTIVHFGHKNWREAVEFTEHCSTKWATFMLSLKDLVERGEGRPAPNDVKISNWH
ncbi:MAG TPA: SRPBCC domain-containing protein [Burkholderiales bacterium]|nr:SRPBCC domain-containing protein [Burkholderiales bacterium]